MARILVVDDEPAILSFLQTLLKREGHVVASAQGGAEALKQMHAAPFDLMITDYMMSPMDGLELLKAAQREFPDMPTIMISGHCDVKNAVEVLKEGAFDYLSKPVKLQDMREVVGRAIEYHSALTPQNSRKIHVEFECIVAESQSMRAVCETMKRVMPATTPALILGEAGVGKQLVARTIHEAGPRTRGEFVAVDCSLRPEEQLEEELFGGPETPDVDPAGKFQTACGGTLYLSEVGSLPLFLQERLDRILAQASSGDVESVRVLTGSKDPLDDMAARGNFMPTLHQRLKTFTMKIDPLRERTEDILSLAHYFLRQRHDGSDSESIGIEKDAELALSHYAWLGNVDELRDALEEAKKSTGDRMIGVDDLPQRLRNIVDLEGVKKRKKAELEQYKGKAMKAFLRDKEKEYLQLVLNSVQDDKEEAAKKLNLDAEGLERHIAGDGA